MDRPLHANQPVTGPHDWAVAAAAAAGGKLLVTLESSIPGRFPPPYDSTAITLSCAAPYALVVFLTVTVPRTRASFPSLGAVLHA